MDKRIFLLLTLLALKESTHASSNQPIAIWGDSLTLKLSSELQRITSRVVFNGGISGNTSTEVLTRQRSTLEMRDWVTVFWYGRNNYGDANQIKLDLIKSIALLNPENHKFVILSILNSAHPHEALGKIGYTAIQKLNSDLENLYPENFIDVRKYLVRHYNQKSTQDVEDFKNDIIPTSLRYDILHLNNEGSRLVANYILQFIEAKGW